MTDSARLSSTSYDGQQTQQRIPLVRRLWLVRHGVTLANSERRFNGHLDEELTAQGELQACLIGTQLRERRVVALYASDLQRARRTGELISQQLGQPLPVQTAAAWRELFFGDWEGLTYDQIVERYPQHLHFFTDPTRFAPVNGEAFSALLGRVQSAFQQLMQEARSLPEGDIVLVSHGGVLRVLLCLLLGMSFERQWQLRLDNGSLSAIDCVPENADVLATATLSLLNWCPVEQSIALNSDPAMVVRTAKDVISHA